MSPHSDAHLGAQAISRAADPACPDAQTPLIDAASAAFSNDADSQPDADRILDSALEYAIIAMDVGGRIIRWSAGAERIIGYPQADVLGQLGDIVFTPEDRDRGVFGAELRRATISGRAENERWHLRRDGTRFWASGVMLPMNATATAAAGFLNIMRDGTLPHLEGERHHLITAEMNHRLKNSFAVVQAIAAQTRRHTADPAAFQQAFAARLLALSRSHDVLVRAEWTAAPLAEVVGTALAAFSAPHRVAIDGPPELLSANVAGAVGLVFHELATNAIKHGALSVDEGRVDITWSAAVPRGATRAVDILWRESGGPAIEPPRQRGFGLQLLERGMPSGGTAQLTFAQTGAECRIRLPLS